MTSSIYNLFQTSTRPNTRRQCRNKMASVAANAHGNVKLASDFFDVF